MAVQLDLGGTGTAVDKHLQSERDDLSRSAADLNVEDLNVEGGLDIAYRETT